MIIQKKLWKVGELAKQTGITVRTLHYYDQIGLLSPSQHSDAGHRLYNEADIARLQQIMSLKQLGFALEEIKKLIDNPNFNPITVIELQLKNVKKQIQLQKQLYSRLEGLHELLNTQQEVKAEQFIKLIGVINRMNVENYFTQEQLEKMKAKTEHFNPEEKRKLENAWVELVSKVRAEMEKGTSPEAPNVILLAKQWNELIIKFTGGDVEIVKSAERFYTENPNNPLQYNVDGELYRYIKKAMSYI